jgi:hypothetical protein
MALARQQQAISLGKTGPVLNSILEKPPREGFIAHIDKHGTLIADPEAGHLSDTEHWYAHWENKNSWLRTINFEHPTKGAALRQAILDGTWQKSHAHILDSLDSKRYDIDTVRSAIDQFKIKASSDQIAILQQRIQAPITFTDFYTVVKSRATGSSPGTNKVSINMIKALPETGLRQLFSVLNAMWTHRHVPVAWKKRILVQIPKSEGANQHSQLRPIMLLDTCRKLWESILMNRFVPWLEAANILDESQCGARSRHGTEDPGLVALNAIEDAITNRKELHIHLQDKVKAFDASTFQLQQLCLQRVGLPADIAKYFTRMDLTNVTTVRSTYSMLFPHKAKSFHIRGGTPQGGTLAPITYLCVADVELSFSRANKHNTNPYYITTHDRQFLALDPMLTTSTRSRLASKAPKGKSSTHKPLNRSLAPI